MVEFKPSRALKNVRLSFLAGFACDPPTPNQPPVLAPNFAWDHSLDDFRIPEKFLSQKQIFTPGHAPIPSWPPLRGQVTDKRLEVVVELAAGPRRIVFDHVFVSFFAIQRILTMLAVVSFDEILVDDLLFIKQGKWYDCDAEAKPWLKYSDGTCGHTYVKCFARFLNDCAVQGVKDEGWPVFDFIELRMDGPSDGPGPNTDDRLPIAEHWGLLMGDEGYRLIDTTTENYELNYKQALVGAASCFHGRRDWLYNFSPTSCLAFVDSNIEASRAAWSEFYAKNVGKIEMIDAYIGFTPVVPALQDGVPLLVEICLLRYAALKRISLLLQSEEGKGLLPRVWDLMIARVRGRTPLESAVRRLKELDLYQESGLWIIGGPYTDSLYEYEPIRKRLDKSIDDEKVISEDVRVFYLGIMTFFLGIVAIVISLFHH
ncbi:MAG: hypothetical protein JO104_02350 [Candidatus Eremiobacteraeota bacterium]|nr:hypothetical protein [Candidatus Eremiobacteraeota bacterium]